LEELVAESILKSPRLSLIGHQVSLIGIDISGMKRSLRLGAVSGVAL